ncbi:Asp23/Gls24 family envelope stress response protein [Rhodococcus sp. SGAir0479]|uniref:Asp23/Gls24 family envelope stress response protein n=1 Tax=Rhodococcus sp. SGAir0479 TaxID=2567884 RepID=UPI0010CCD5F1|nr:Asp23/Gls24 family envelope stress response protein [Rhodococcus sp. SGAir0479]QCQ93607.1 Asp23/Gls24 family envelope stress response protein [Rhodococcus sp. SGAir0479]
MDAASQELTAARIAEIVSRVPGVAALDGGMFGEVATYLPHERILGVRLRDDGSVDVHVTAYRGVPLPQLAARIRRALAENVRIDVTIADIVEPG